MHSSRLYFPRQECFVTVQRMRYCGSSVTPGLFLSWSDVKRHRITQIMIRKLHNVSSGMKGKYLSLSYL